MKRTGFKSRGKPLSAKKPMNRTSKKRRNYRASDEGRAAMEYMGLVKQLPCCICNAPGPSEAHHCRSDFMARDDFKTIPLCIPCHKGPNGYHGAKKPWEAKNGPDHGFVEETRKKVGEMI